MARGIERRKIFFDDKDCDEFISRLGEVVIETRTLCYAWALIPNHFHLLLKTGRVPGMQFNAASVLPADPWYLITN